MKSFSSSDATLDSVKRYFLESNPDTVFTRSEINESILKVSV